MAFKSHDPELAHAVNLWSHGRIIPSELWAKLTARGYNMHRLEALHFNF